MDRPEPCTKMSKIFNKNAILTSRCDSYCLVCDEHLRGDEDMVAHIVTPSHKTALRATSYSEKYEADRIRKVAAGYYCEECNLLIKLAAKVGTHMSDEGHLKCKTDRISIRKTADGVMLEEFIFVKEDAWHGIKDMECSPCDSEIDDITEHIKGMGHVLNLVSAEVIIDKDSNFYRMEHDATLQCLTCDVFLNENAMIAHLDDPEHKRLSQLHKANQTNTSNKSKEETEKQGEKFTKPLENGTTSGENTKVSVETERSKIPTETKEAQKELPGSDKDVAEIKEMENREKPEKSLLNGSENAVNSEKTSNFHETDPKAVDLKTEKLELTKEEKSMQSSETDDLKKGTTTMVDKDNSATKIETINTDNTKRALGKEKPSKPAELNEVVSKTQEPKQETAEKEKSMKAHENGINTETSKVANEEEKLNKTAKSSDAEAKPEPKKPKTTTSKNKMNKIDEEICKALGAVDYVAPDAQGRQWCILCDWAMDQASVKPHVNGKHHQIMLKMHTERANKKEMQVDQQKENPQTDAQYLKIIEESGRRATDANRNSIIDASEEFQMNDIKLDCINDTAYCRVCSKNVPWKFEVIRGHIDEHKLNLGKTSSTSSVQKTSKSPTRKEGKSKQEKVKERATVTSDPDTDVEVENFAKQHKLHYTRDSGNAFCSVCVTNVTASVRYMKEHINGVNHKNNVAKAVKTVANTIAKKPSYEFIERITTVENMFYKDIVVNEQYVVNIFSFMLMTRRGENYQCQACETYVANSEIDAHKRTPLHEQIMNDVPVVFSEASEFIREIRPNLFHCGFCNHLESPWSMMESHLQSTAHREAKTTASWRLQEYSPVIMQHRAKQEMELRVFNAVQMSTMFGVH